MQEDPLSLYVVQLIGSVNFVIKIRVAYVLMIFVIVTEILSNQPTISAIY